MANRTDAQLWEAYRSTGSDKDRNAICDFHWPFIYDQIARLLKSRDNPPPLGDILSHVAEHVLTNVIPAFDADRGQPFRKYLFHHIGLAALEAIRSGDQRHRRQRERVKNIRSERDKLSQTLGYRPTDAELAEYMGVPEIDIATAIGEPEVQADVICADDPAESFEVLIDGLNPEWQEALRQYYQQGYTQEEIASMMGVSQRAVSLRIEAAMAFLRDNF